MQTAPNYGLTPFADEDGNLTQDGLWIYYWDCENRLLAMESAYSLPDDVRTGVEFRYDHQGRRIEKVVYVWDAQEWNYITQSTNRFVYDGWNLIAVLDCNNAPLLSFAWGADLSGSLQGAGGVGGLLAVTVHSGANAGTYFCGYDGNGNVVALVNAAHGSVAARYEYGPFGELLRVTGSMAKQNPIRWSTKYTDDETDLVMYPARPYSPSNGRWLSRDPSGERGGQNLYAFARNQPISRIDPDGRADIETPTICPKCGKSVNPLDGSCDCQPPASIDCSGYASLGGKTCKTCFGFGTRKDGYPEKAHKVCEGFRDMYTGTPMQSQAACVARCLIAAEGLCQKLPLCSSRNCCRLAAHVACYEVCFFVPYKGLPPGGAEVGALDLIPSCASKGAF